ncbi:MAG: NERD domain-containing protein [Desulfococcaceae bacterium]|jgi:hypothetical protein|nr:NERD domain-containing protein [Desulfococcaceae bacterium]
MAVMWPAKLPRDVLDNVLRSSECQVYRRLEAVLEDPFVVFYSSPWLGIKPDGEEIDGECDFVVAHPDLGFLTLEVKGGAVSYDPKTEQWTSVDRWGLTHNIKNPVQQARTSKYELLNKLKNSKHWKERRICIRHGVVLPHSAAPSGDLGADMPRHIFCFYEDFGGDFRNWILRRFGHNKQERGAVEKIGNDGISALEHILAKPFQLRTPLGSMLSADDSDIQQLTQQQYHILRAIEAVKRSAICGGAGTGKTVLAIEEARRCAEKGMRTLITCFNRPLAMDIQRRIGNRLPVTVKNFHDLCSDFTRQAGVSIPENIPKYQLFNDRYPELLMQVFEKQPEKCFDAIIVDEGQDFLPIWWMAIDTGLHPEGQKLLRIFYDSNQRIYESAGKLPEDVSLIPIRLTLNLRNTKRIHELVRQHYSGHAIESIGPEGVEVKWIKSKGPKNLRERISKYITHLISNEKIGVENIALLLSSENAIKEFIKNGRMGGYAISRCDKPKRNSLIVDSIRRFKGLESPVVILAVTPEIISNKELPYVALSRARTHLAIVGSDEDHTKLRG